MDRPRVDIGIAATLVQSPAWWGPLFSYGHAWQKIAKTRVITSQAASASVAKNILADSHIYGSGQADTGENRNALTALHIVGDGEYLLQIDQDTIPPMDVLERLLNLKRLIVGGVYYHRNAPHLPLIYDRVEDGRYHQVRDFERGVLRRADAIGMGCTLIHRSVFEEIQAQCRVFRRPNGSIFLVHESDLQGERYPSRIKTEGVYTGKHGDRYFVQPVEEVSLKVAVDQGYPFYSMEHNRTEDMYFCEFAQKCGFEIYVDTSIECTHLQQVAITADIMHELRNIDHIEMGEDATK